MGFDCVITKRENAIEKKDFMVISNYFQYPGTVFINLLHTHTHTHTHTLPKMAILCQRRDKICQK